MFLYLYEFGHYKVYALACTLLGQCVAAAVSAPLADAPAPAPVFWCCLLRAPIDTSYQQPLRVEPWVPLRCASLSVHFGLFTSVSAFVDLVPIVCEQSVRSEFAGDS